MQQLEDFMCVCSDEARTEAEASYARVLADLGCAPADLVSAVVFALNWNLPDGYYGAITGIICGQWAGVGAEVHTYEGKERADHARIFVQCDHVEHGIARVWELARDACPGQPRDEWRTARSVGSGEKQ